MDRCSRVFSFTQLICEPTRICGTTSSIIDLILVSDTKSISQSGVLIYGISDHFLTFCLRRAHRITFNCHKSISARSLKRYSVVRLIVETRMLAWASVLDSDNVNQAWGNFKRLFSSAIDSVAPARTVNQAEIKSGVHTGDP